MSSRRDIHQRVITTLRAIRTAVAPPGSRARFDPARLIVVVLVGLVLTSTFAYAQTAGDPVPVDPSTIPEPEPGVEKTYNETFRIFVSNDNDPLRTTENFTYVARTDDGGVELVNETIQTPPLEYDLWGNRPRETLLRAYATDQYSRVLGRPEYVGYKDRWVPIEESGIHPADAPIRIIRVTPNGTATPTDTAGTFRVEILNQYGGWDPVYRAEITTTSDGPVLTNRDEVLIHLGSDKLMWSRKADALESLMRYSAYADDEETARERASIPMDNGSEVFPTRNGATISRKWEEGNYTIVRDAYVSIQDVIPGVWYRGKYVAPSHQLNTYTPYDYRIQTPPAYSEQIGTCTISDAASAGDGDASGDSPTQAQAAPIMRWAKYDIISSNATNTASISNESYTLELFNWAGRPGSWSTLDDRTPELHPLVPGEYTLTTNLTISAEIRTRWGVTSPGCTEWTNSETVRKTMNLTYSEKVSVVSTDAMGLDIDVHVYDRPGTDTVVINWTGDQDLDAVPWRNINIQIGNKRLQVQGPYHFYWLGRNTHVEVRTPNGTRTYNASDSWNGTYPRLTYHGVAVTNVTVTLVENSPTTTWWSPALSVVNRTLPPTNLPSNVVTVTDGSAPLYDQFAFNVHAAQLDTQGEPVHVSADGVFKAGNLSDVNVTRTRYRRSELTASIIEDGETNETRARIRLLNERGEGIPGRALSLQGAKVETVTTNASGEATVTVTGFYFAASFAGDEWNDSVSTYYTGAQTGMLNPYAAVGPVIGNVSEYLTLGINEVILLIEWIALGLFALWWTRLRNPNPNQ